MIKRKGILSNLVWLYTSEFVLRIGSFFIIVLLARYLGDYTLGVYSYAFALAGLVIFSLDFGILNFMVKEIAKDKSKTKKYFDNITTLRFCLGLLAILILFIITPLINKTSSESKIVYFAGFALFFNFMGYAFRSLYQAYEDMKHIAIAQIIERSIAIILGSIVLINGYPLEVFLYTLILSYLTFFLYLYITTRKITIFHFKIDFNVWKKIFLSSLPFWFTEIFFVIYFRIDAIMLPLFKNFEVTGWYSAAYKIIEGLGFIPILAVIALFPAMSRMHKENKDQLRKIYYKSLYYLFAIVIPLSLSIFILADRIILFLYKDQFSQSIYALQILVVSLLFLFPNYIMGFLLNSIDKQKLFAYTAGIGVIINIILNIILIPLFKYGYQGAAIGTIIAQLFNFISLYYFTSKNGYKIKLLQMIYKPLIAAFIMAIGIYILKGYHLLIILALGSFIYLLSFYFLKGINEEEINLIKVKIKSYMGLW